MSSSVLVRDPFGFTDGKKVIDRRSKHGTTHQVAIPLLLLLDLWPRAQSGVWAAGYSSDAVSERACMDHLQSFM